MFFRGYEPWNVNNEAIVYIIEDDGKIKENKSLFKDSNLTSERVLGKHVLTYI
jgi:hypothetical protein